MKYWEDVEPGIDRFGNTVIDRDDVIEFAERFDPQPFHLSDEAAAQTHFGRMCASGWHTASLSMRMMVDFDQLSEFAFLGSPGLSELRWPHPVYPGDVLTCEREMLSKRRSASRPGMGLVESELRTLNQDGTVVMVMRSSVFVKVRDPQAV